MGGWSGRKRLKRGENTEETIKEKCKHGIQISDKRHKTTFHLPILNSPLSFSGILRLVGCQATRILSKLCQRDRERKACMIKVALLIAIISWDVYV